MNTGFLSGRLVDEIDDMSLADLAGLCACETGWIIELVEEGILDPRGQTHAEWRFSGTCLMRARTAMRLQHDLNINIEGIALAIELMDELNELQARLRVLEQGI